ncbi:hypothetical protein Tco_0707109 [Tanacetum coccineum]|uniref:Uncharacterized protein n=1 Tax=Tanacetum coccineum TaxID=301880 RepID=A0ABQ4YBH4_9ASTR
MVVKLGYGVADLMYYHFLRPRLSLDLCLHPLTINADVLELEKYIKNNKIILVYVKHRSTYVETIFATPKKGVAIQVNNQLRKAPIEIDRNPDVNRNLTPMCSRNLTKDGSEVDDSDDLDYDPKDDERFDDDEHILEDVLVNMNNYNFNPDTKHDLSIVVTEVHEHDLDVIDYDTFSSDLDEGIDMR